MRIAGARRMVHRAQQRAADQARGCGRSLIHVSAGRAADLAFADTRRLPAQLSYTALQDSGGQFLFLPGYSDPGGSDANAATINPTPMAAPPAQLATPPGIVLKS